MTTSTTAHGSEAPSRLAQLRYALSRGPALERLRLALAAHALRSLRLHRECGYVTLADYVRERLDRRLSTFYDWSDAGRVFAHSARARREFRRGRLPFSSAVVLSRTSAEEALALMDLALSVSTTDLRAVVQGPPGDPPPRASAPRAPSTADPRYVRVQVRLPRSAAVYCEQTLELARALCGEEVPTAEALAAVVAEASTELSRPRRGAFRALPSMKVLGECPHPPRRRPADWPALPAPRDRARLAHRLDAVCRDALRRLDRWQARAEDLLLECRHTEEHLAHGDPSFFRFVADTLALPRSTAHEMIQRARMRRIDHPLHVARARGELGPVKAALLRTLEGMGVPRSALPAWIERARGTTVRMLRRMIAAARRLAATDLRAWAMRDFAPPSEADVRTSETPLTELAARPRLPRAESLAHEPLHTLRWTLDRADHLLLLELADQIPDRRAPSWWPLVRIFHLARQAWRHAPRLNRPHPHRAVLERDRYHCQVPGCSKRAVEGHHIVYRSRGGADAPENLIAACPTHHRHGVHAGRLRIAGSVTDDRQQLRFDLGVDGRGRPLVSYRGEMLEAEA